MRRVQRGHDTVRFVAEVGIIRRRRCKDRVNADMAAESSTITEALLRKWREHTPRGPVADTPNNAGASLMPASVLRAITRYLEQEAEEGGYEVAYQQRGAIEAAYAAVAQVVGAAPRNIAVV